MLFFFWSGYLFAIYIVKIIQILDCVFICAIILWSTYIYCVAIISPNVLLAPFWRLLFSKKIVDLERTEMNRNTRESSLASQVVGSLGGFTRWWINAPLTAQVLEHMEITVPGSLYGFDVLKVSARRSKFSQFFWLNFTAMAFDWLMFVVMSMKNSATRLAFENLLLNYGKN